MPAVVDKVSHGIEEVRERRPLLDHLIRTVQHYGKVKGNLHAGAISYFGFLSLFPLLALLFFVVGVVSTVYPGADDQVRTGVAKAFPGIIGGSDGISLEEVKAFTGLAAVVGVLGVLYTGLGFIQVLREALTYVFERSQSTASFVKLKLSDLLALATIGGTFVLSIALGSVLTRFSGALLDLLGLDSALSWVLVALALAVGFATNVVLFFVMFRQLVHPETPSRSLLTGAILGAIGFELIKQLSATLIGLTQGNPAFQAFGIALVVIVLLNYFARLTLYAASWAHTSPAARALRSEGPDPVQGPQLPDLATLTGARGVPAEPPAGSETSAVSRWGAPFAAGGATVLALVAMMRKKDS